VEKPMKNSMSLKLVTIVAPAEYQGSRSVTGSLDGSA
jgi:hypothetical protein